MSYEIIAGGISLISYFFGYWLGRRQAGGNLFAACSETSTNSCCDAKPSNDQVNAHLFIEQDEPKVLLTVEDK